MGNIYFVDKKFKVWDNSEDAPKETIMVHSWVGLEKLEELKKLFPYALIKGMFCSYCGNYIPCGCDNPTPQKVGDSAPTFKLDISKVEPIEEWYSTSGKPNKNCKDCKGTGKYKETDMVCPCSLDWHKK